MFIHTFIPLNFKPNVQLTIIGFGSRILSTNAMIVIIKPEERSCQGVNYDRAKLMGREDKDIKTTPLTLGDKFKAFRDYKGLTLQELASMLGISATTISETERNQSEPGYKTLRAYIMKTEINPFYLFDLSEQKMIKDIPPPDYGDIAGMY